VRLLLSVLLPLVLQEEEATEEAEEEQMSRVGFCFTGEGARGSVQAGIALGLYDMGIKADFTIGISSGSVCSASYAHLGPRGLADMWSGIGGIFDVFGVNWLFPFKRGLMNQRPMERIVRRAVKKEPICESVVVRMNIEDGRMDYVSNKSVSPEEFGEAVLGAVAITALVEDRDGWVDAGSRQLAPLEQCMEAGCDRIYVIMGRRFDIARWSLPKGFMPAIKMAYRALDVSLNEIMMRDITRCLKNEGEPGYRGVEIHLVEPDETPFETVEFSRCAEGVEYGRSNFSISDRRGMMAALNIPQS
jgi:predicted acylesterase/phospholipase RssA